MHSGAAVLDGRVLAAHPGEPALLADDAGSVYVTEWLIGGRLPKLTRT